MFTFNQSFSLPAFRFFYFVVFLFFPRLVSCFTFRIYRCWFFVAKTHFVNFISLAFYFHFIQILFVFHFEVDAVEGRGREWQRAWKREGVREAFERNQS